MNDDVEVFDVKDDHGDIELIVAKGVFSREEMAELAERHVRKAMSENACPHYDEDEIRAMCHGWKMRHSKAKTEYRLDALKQARRLVFVEKRTRACFKCTILDYLAE